MGFFRKFAQSPDLVGGMAERLGIDMTARMLRDPEIEAPRFRSMALRCAACAGQAGCAQLQAENAHLDAPPGYCRNHRALMSLA